MASVSGASGLGNTSLRGFGGMASGIDRDALIEQMTLGTTTKITNKKNEITSLEWKQEAYRNVIDKIIDMEDNYFSYSSKTSLIDPTFFSRNQISTLGDSSVTKYVTATGSSSMLDYVSILGVKQLATSATLTSEGKKVFDSIALGAIKGDIFDDKTCKSANMGTIEFGAWNGEKYVNSARFTLPSSYKDAGGKTQTIDYMADLSTEDARKELAAKLNEALKQSGTKLEGTDVELKDVIEFSVVDDGNNSGKIQITQKGGDKFSNTLVVKPSCTAANLLGFDKDKLSDPESVENGISLSDFNTHTVGIKEAIENQSKSVVDYMTNRSINVTFGGRTKSITLLTDEEAAELKKQKDDGKTPGVEDIAKLINKRLDSAFGKGNVVAGVDASGTLVLSPVKKEIKAEIDNANNKVKVTLAGTEREIEIPKDGGVTDIDELNSRLDEAFGKGMVRAKDNAGTLEFELGDNAKETLSVGCSKDVRTALGIENTSNKMGLDSSIADNWDNLGFSSKEDCIEQLKNGLTINGEKIDINGNSTINQMMSAINSSKAGVKATYLSTTNQFVLLASETGKGREIDVEGAAATIFGGESKDGQNAQVEVSYGNGITTTVENTSNTINLDGLNIAVSGTFGYDETGKLDSSKAVTFTANADVDGATERVKKFIEEYNALVSAVNTEMTTRPDSDYGPLTDEQKDEMSETSIENWENKAKQGLLFGDTYLRGLSDSLQSMMVKILRNNVDGNDLKEIGITVSDDWKDGGQLIFDETKFKDAMKSDPDKVSRVICGNGDGKTGMVGSISDSLSNYATRFSHKHKGSYGSLVDVAGSTKLARTVSDNQIYKQLEQLQEDLERLKATLSTEQDRYISQFSTMETLISQMNSQSSYLSGLSAQ